MLDSILGQSLPNKLLTGKQNNYYEAKLNKIWRNKPFLEKKMEYFLVLREKNGK
jgi:hypothetical protein